MGDRVYCYENSNVLKNKLGIRDGAHLQDIERQLVMLRIMELEKCPLQGAFDLWHLQSIHRYLFQDIYTWAGHLRTVDIAKGNMFCNVKFLHIQAEEIFGKLNAENYLSGLDMEEMANRLAYYLSEINALHPFREGNGRTQREFIQELAYVNGYAINFSKATKQEMLAASKDSFLCKYEKMEKLMQKCIRRR